MEDTDGDGYGDSNAQSPVLAGSDCLDTLSSVNPMATDIAGDSIDQNCDGVDGTDFDGDGDPSVISGGTDCDDTDSTIENLDVDGDGTSTCDIDCDDNDPNTLVMMMVMASTYVKMIVMIRMPMSIQMSKRFGTTVSMETVMVPMTLTKIWMVKIPVIMAV